MATAIKIRKYLRYVDDFALFSDDYSYLGATREAIEAYLAQLRLKIHPIKSQLFETKYGATFLGFRIFPEKIRVRNKSLAKGRKRLRKLQKDYLAGKIDESQIKQSLQSWMAHLNYGDTWRLQQQIFGSLLDEF